MTTETNPSRSALHSALGTALFFVAVLVALIVLTSALPAVAGDPPPTPRSPEQTTELFRTAQRQATARAAEAPLLVESEVLYTLRFTERPGIREFLTRPVDPVGLKAAPRPPFWWPEARVHWGEYLWTGRVESFDDDEPVSLLDREHYRLVRVAEVEARGETALRLVFEALEGSDRVTVVVDGQSFEPVSVEQELLRPVTADGARLVEYRLSLSLTARGGYWLVAQGEESYRFTTPQGDREVEHSWKSLSWSQRPESRRVALKTGV